MKRFGVAAGHAVSPEASDFTAYEYHWNVLPILIVREISFCTGALRQGRVRLGRQAVHRPGETAH